MGNSQDPQNISNNPLRQKHLNLTTQNQNRHSQGGLAKHRAENRPTVQPSRPIHSPTNSREKQKERSKHKRYLSLSKTADAKPISLIQSRCVSANKKKILLTHPSEPTIYGMSRVIQFEKKIGLNGSNAVKNQIIKPRDLPRYTSHRVIPSIHQNTVPVVHIYPPPIHHHRHSTPIPPPYNYPPETIQIKFTTPQEYQTHNRKESQLSTSSVIPFKPNTKGQEWFSKPLSVQTLQKKLKKVALSRSYILNDEQVPNQNNQQDAAFRQEIKTSQTIHDTQNMKSIRTSTDIPDSDKDKENIFTDPKLLSYIADHGKYVPMKQSQSKYALAYEADGIMIQHPTTLEEITANVNIQKKYSIGYYGRQRLQDKVEREVESKQVIEQSFHFPTATDISEEERSDNTSFIPIRRQELNLSNKSNPFNNQQVLQYCKPKINERVLADLLKLPLKN